MGGYGSGGWNRSGRGTVEEHRSLTIGRLRQAGVLEPGWYGGWQWTVDGERVADIRLVGGRDIIRLSYRVRAGEGPWQEVDEPVAILWRPCRFGGERPFFLCPGCARPVLKLSGAGCPLSMPALLPAGLRLVPRARARPGLAPGQQAAAAPRRRARHGLPDRRPA